MNLHFVDNIFDIVAESWGSQTMRVVYQSNDTFINGVLKCATSSPLRLTFSVLSWTQVEGLRTTSTSLLLLENAIMC